MRLAEVEPKFAQDNRIQEQALLLVMTLLNFVTAMFSARRIVKRKAVEILRMS